MSEATPSASQEASLDGGHDWRAGAYRALARRLDAIPNGFSPTASGVELRLLARLFSPEEAALASLMRLTPEPAVAIAERAGLAMGEARTMLKGMVRRGLLHLERGQGQLLYALTPFVVGFYEAQGPTLDAELASLFEAYMQEMRGGDLLGSNPPIHRVLPVGETIDTRLDVLPYQRASDLVAQAKAWGVADCICRKQQKLVGKGCDAPMENCLAFTSVEGAFNGSRTMRAISKEDALRILKEAEDAGLVHTTMNLRQGVDYICNCCPCCCGVLRGVAEFAVPSAVAHSGLQAAVDGELCVACGDCVERCPAHAISVDGDVAAVERPRCLGCGLCVTTCPSGALSLVPRPEGERIEPPADMQDWRRQRAHWRGIPLEEIL